MSIEWHGTLLFAEGRCVGTVSKTKRGTYWAVHFYMGNVHTALPTEQEARDLMMVLARSHYGVA